MISEERECYLCGSRGTLHVHHCLNGSRRKLADEDGLMIYLCPYCHAVVHDKDARLQRELKVIAEKHYLESHTFDEWMRRYGRNYIEEIS